MSEDMENRGCVAEHKVLVADRRHVLKTCSLATLYK